MLVSSLLLAVAAPWPTGEASAPLTDRLEPPPGYGRVEAPAGSFGAWLRQLPILPGRPDVLLHDGRKKRNQDAHHLVVDIDPGKKDLQQCADAVMRLFAEWQWSAKNEAAICFRFTSGHELRWDDYKRGTRPAVRGSTVRFSKIGGKDSSYTSFRKYLDQIFTYAGTASLAKDLLPVSDPRAIQIGDVFIQGGFPGHAILVVDVVENRTGDRMFAVAQSFMPAQQIHVLSNPGSSGPWYRVRAAGKLETPEWAFEWADLRRFRASACP